MLSPRSACRLRFANTCLPCKPAGALPHCASILCPQLGGAYLLRALGAQRSQGTAVLKLSSSPAPGKALGVQWVQRWHVGHTTSVQPVHHTGPVLEGPTLGSGLCCCRLEMLKDIRPRSPRFHSTPGWVPPCRAGMQSQERTQGSADPEAPTQGWPTLSTGLPVIVLALLNHNHS